MDSLVEQHLPQIIQICRRFGVRRLELFGSATGDRFDPARSDVDFLVEFADYSLASIADDWFGLQEELSRVLGVPVDLTSLRTVANPYFLRQINQSRVTLYAA